MTRYILLLSLIAFTIEKSKVYFSKEISPEKIVELYKKLNVKLEGNVALKIHSGEVGGKYFLRPSFLKKIHDYTNGTFVECNAAYNTTRHNTSIHNETLKINGWFDDGIRSLIMDEHPENDWNLTLDSFNIIKNNIVGEHLKDFDSCLVLAHLKGHGMGGFGGALKQLSIGFASRPGKSWIHSAGKDHKEVTWDDIPESERFTAAMADAATSIVNYFRNKNKGGIAFINVMVNISKACDCAGAKAPPPEIEDIGILASTDPIAIDRASIDFIRKTNGNGTEDWLTQLANLKGEKTIDFAEKLGIGTSDYEIINVDESEPDSKQEPESFFSSMTFYIILGVIGLLIIVFIVVCVIKGKGNKEDENLVDGKITDE